MSKIDFSKLPGMQRIDYGRQFWLAKLELYGRGLPIELTEEEWKRAEEEGFVTIENIPVV